MFGAGLALAGVAGGLLSMLYEISPSMGEPYTVTALIVITLGGLGSALGSLLGGFLLGVIEALGMHYTSVPNILKVLNPLFLDDLREKLEEAGTSPQKLLNLRKRMARIRVFEVGRVYLPREDLETFGMKESDLVAGRHGDAFVRLMRHEAARAHAYYRSAWAAYPPGDARSLVAAEIMGRIYFALLGEIEARGFQVFGERIRVPTLRKMAIAARAWTSAHLRPRAPRLTGAPVL